MAVIRGNSFVQMYGAEALVKDFTTFQNYVKVNGFAFTNGVKEPNPGLGEFERPLFNEI